MASPTASAPYSAPGPEPCSCTRAGSGGLRGALRGVMLLLRGDLAGDAAIAGGRALRSTPAGKSPLLWTLLRLAVVPLYSLLCSNFQACEVFAAWKTWLHSRIVRVFNSRRWSRASNCAWTRMLKSLKSSAMYVAALLYLVYALCLLSHYCDC